MKFRTKHLILALIISISGFGAYRAQATYSNASNKLLLANNLEALAGLGIPWDEENSHNGMKDAPTEEGYNSILGCDYTYYRCQQGNPQDWCEEYWKDWL